MREVVAHVTMPARYDAEAFMTALAAVDFDFTRLSNDIAARDAELPTAELVADVRSATLHQWTPPGGGWLGALNHAVVHALDVAVPLGWTDVVDDETVTIVLDDLTAGGTHAHFGKVLDGRRLEASDVPWAFGSGAVLRGPARELALAVCGRTVPSSRLEGAPV